MRTKTMLLSALLGALGSVSVMAQTNVYSLNAVGYINVTAQPGFNIISCPLIASPTNTIGYLLNNSSNQLKKALVYSYSPSAPGGYVSDEASVALAQGNGYTNGWAEGGTITMLPGQAVWFANPFSSNITLTFVGTVPTGSLTNTISTGFNLISSILPASGDLVTNSLMNFTNATKRDEVYVYDQLTAGDYDLYNYTTANGWQTSTNGATIDMNPQVPFVGAGFWYATGSAGISWVENFSVSQ
jgi:hypothetical protein